VKTIVVKSLRGTYKIVTGSGLLEKSGSLIAAAGVRGKILVVTQKNIAKWHLQKVEVSLKKSGFTSQVYYLPEGETAKSSDELFKLYAFMLEKGFERRDAILALGGGVTGDLSGFAAATYLRGIAFLNAPTTLLAQVDSAIGGKTGINLKEGKNLVGAFYPPKVVISDVQPLTTLPARELQAALAEVVKYGVISDPKLFALLERSADKILSKDTDLLHVIVEASSRIKAGVVSRDEFETSGERMILNFGHTFGHGFEKAFDFKKLLHGEAVSIGMVCAARLAAEMKMLPGAEVERIENLLRSFGLPLSIAGMNAKASDITAAMMHDKKKKAGKLRFVLPVKIGKVVVRDDVPARLIEKIILEAGAKK
jgi:3-dehydroquinate synthase